MYYKIIESGGSCSRFRQENSNIWMFSAVIRGKTTTKTPVSRESVVVSPKTYYKIPSLNLFCSPQFGGQSLAAYIKTKHRGTLWKRKYQRSRLSGKQVRRISYWQGGRATVHRHLCGRNGCKVSLQLFLRGWHNSRLYCNQKISFH